eukprot:COSAG01_NODE_2326_length_7903_cov_22.624552_1_plen_212_part_00
MRQQLQQQQLVTQEQGQQYQQQDSAKQAAFERLQAEHEAETQRLRLEHQAEQQQSTRSCESSGGKRGSEREDGERGGGGSFSPGLVLLTAGHVQLIALWLRAGASSDGRQEKKEGAGHHHGGSGAERASVERRWLAVSCVLRAACCLPSVTHFFHHSADWRIQQSAIRNRYTNRFRRTSPASSQPARSYLHSQGLYCPHQRPRAPLLPASP